MESYHYHLPLLLLLLLLLLFRPSSASPGLVGLSLRASSYYVGVNINKVPVVLQNMGVPRVRILDADAKAVSVLADTGIIVNLSIEDTDIIASFATNKTNACHWVRSMVMAIGRRVKISTVSIGSNVLIENPEFTDTLLKALENVRHSLDGLGRAGVAVTTSHSYDVIQGVFPPSAGKFNETLLPQMARLLHFMNRTRAPLQIEMYPYKVYKDGTVPNANLKYAMFEVDSRDEVTMVDSSTGLRYISILDMMIDSVIAALKKAGYGDMPLEVTGTGWPWRGNDKISWPLENVLSAGEYNSRVITVYNSRAGTPLRPYQPTIVYINGLLDDDSSETNDITFLSNLGFLNADASMRYSIGWKAQTSDGATVPSPTAVAPTTFLFWLFIVLL